MQRKSGKRKAVETICNFRDMTNFRPRGKSYCCNFSFIFATQLSPLAEYKGIFLANQTLKAIKSWINTCCVTLEIFSHLHLNNRRPYRLPTHELPTGRQFRGRQFMVHQSTGLPTLIMKTYFYMFWTIHGKYNRLQCSSPVSHYNHQDNYHYHHHSQTK